MATTETDPTKTGSPEMVLAQKILDEVKTLGTGFKDQGDKIKAVQDQIGTLDLKALNENVEKLKTGMEKVEAKIRRTKDAHWFPGIEDAHKDFSLCKALVASVTKNWDADAPYEKEVIAEARKHAQSAVSGTVGKAAGFAVGAGSAAPFIPDQMLADVIGAIYTRSVLVALDPSAGSTRCTVLDGLMGSPVKIPRFFGGAQASWIGEEGAYAQSKMRAGMETMAPKKLGILLGVTDEMRRFPVPAWDALLRQDMLRAAAKKIDATAFYGAGDADTPKGLSTMFRYGTDTTENAVAPKTAGTDPRDTTNNPLKPGVLYCWAQYADGSPNQAAPASPAGGDISFDLLQNAQGLMEDLDLEPDDSFWWFFHPRAERRLKQLKIKNFSGQTDSQPYLLGAPMLTDEKLKNLIGNYDTTTQLASTNTVGSLTSKCGDIFGGNWREFLFGRWSGTEMADDQGMGTGFQSDVAYVKLRMYCDFGHREQRAIIRIPDVQVRP